MDRLNPGLLNEIREYLDSRSEIEGRRKSELEQMYGRKRDFVRALAGLFNTPEVIELLKVTLSEVPIFAHYQSSMGAAMTGSPPSYELVVSREGLVEKRNGVISNRTELPADYDTWYSFVPYGGLFHDSSSGDYTFEPDQDKFLEQMERRLIDIVNVHRHIDDLRGLK